MLWFAFAAAAADVAVFQLGQDENFWSLGDEIPACAVDASVIVDRDSSRDALGIAGYAAAPRVTADMAELLRADPRCDVRVTGKVVDVTGCPDALAEVTREAVAKWKWQRDEPHEFNVAYSLLDGWKFGDECWFPFYLYGSGTPVLDNSGVAGCPTPAPEGNLMLPVMPEGVRRVVCTARVTATAEGAEAATVEGCDEPYASVVTTALEQWRFKAIKGAPTRYAIRLTLYAPPPQR